MSSADPDHDGYDSDDYEPDSPTHPSPSRSQLSHSPVAIAQQQQLTFQFDTDAPSEDESNGEVVTPLPKTKSKRDRTSREPNTVSGRHLMDNTPWTYTVSSLQVRMLRIPVTESAAIRELRVFATIDKQAAQSRGSRWKQELHSVGGGSPLRSTKKRGRRSRSPRRMERYRRSGLIEEAKWVKGDGKLQWTFPMEKFRRLKAYAPRIKTFVYGVGETGVVYDSRRQMENLARQEKEGTILSFGWFFLDLRTPDLPERWLKLQNSPFGGEILISSTFSPVGISPTQSAMKSMDRMTHARGQTGIATVKKVPTIVSGESGEYLQIGDGNGQDIFVLSVFIQAALNLSKVVGISMGDQQDLGKTGFWLSYSLFNVVVQTDVFYNLSAAEFSPIRDSFRVKSNLKDLTLCIASLGSLTVFLCTENQVLAGVEIPLRPLLSKGLFARSAINEDAPQSGGMSEIEGDFSFPDFDEAVISASFAVELVEPKIPETTITKQQMSQVEKAKQGIEIEELDGATSEQGAQTDTSAVTSGMAPAKQILFKLDHLRLKISALAPFTGEKSMSVEVTFGEERVSGELVFCSYTKQQTFATSPALGMVLENVSSQLAIDTPIHIRCFSSASKRLIAASAEDSKIIHDDKSYPKTIVFDMLNESKQSAGQCLLICTSGPDSHQKLGGDLLNDASGDKHHYRICLKLKSVKDVEIPGGYSLRYLNPFLRSASISSEWFTVKDKGEVDTLNFYCMFDLMKDPLQLKQEMQESVNIDLISSDEERIGSATFSLSYLYFSEERFCCSEDNCEEIFMTQIETEAHWLEVHTESALPNTQAGPEAYSHSYRSCSISIPIVSADNNNESTTYQPQRMGSIRVSAYLEDIGLLTEKRTEEERGVLFLPPPPLQEKERNRDESSTDPQLLVTTPVSDIRERSNSTSVIREAEEINHSTVRTRGSAIENTQPNVEQYHNHEREKEVVHFKEALERERSAWKQEQHLQQLQWKRRFAEMEKARMDELEEEWARREEERSNLLKAAQEEYQRLEQTLRKSLADLETRERRLAIAEAALHREQEAKHDENESLQRRLKSEQNHTLSMAKKQTEAYERRISLLETQLSDAERRTKQVEADFVEYRQQQRKLPESRLREEIAALKGSVSELEKQKMAKERECEIAESSVHTMKAQLEQMASLLTQEKKKHEARVVDELEKLRVKYIAREEKYVLDGDRDELRAIKKQLDDLKGFKLKRDGENRRLHRQRSHETTSPQHPRNHWHTQSRQTAFVRHSRSTNHQFENLESSFHSDHASGDESDWDTSSCVGTKKQSTTPQISPHVSRSERDLSISRSRTFDHQETPMPTNLKIGDGDLNASDTYVVPPDTELGRLLRERKLLLASGAYDAQSYLVRELDRLISVTKANAEHHSSIA